MKLDDVVLFFFLILDFGFMIVGVYIFSKFVNVMKFI